MGLRMLAKRIIPCLDVNQGRVVKGTNFLNLRDAGDPVEVAARYDEEGADELVFLDITASHEEREIIWDVVRRTAEVCFMPLTVGGGIRTLDDIRALLKAGADKVSINSAAVRDPEFVRRAARRFGSQCIVVNIDPKRVDARRPRGLGGPHQRRPGADRAGGGGLGARGRAAGGRRDRPDQHGRRRHQERLRPADDPRGGRRRRDPGGRLGRGGQPRAPAGRPGRGGRQRGPGRQHLPLSRVSRSPRPRTIWRGTACPSALRRHRRTTCRRATPTPRRWPVLAEPTSPELAQPSSTRVPRSASPWRPPSKRSSRPWPTSPRPTSCSGW